jgi:hypothetical protein
MATVAENLRIHWHHDPNRPPMTPSEVATLSQTIGGLKRSKTTIANARQTLSRYEDKAEKKSDSGMFLNAGLKTLSDVVYLLEQAIDMLESARNYAKEGK